MKTLLTIILLSSAVAQAQSLFDYTVFTKADVHAECSDFLGRTGVGGEAYLRDFLIQASDAKNCPLEVKGTLKMLRGSVENGQHWACVNSGPITNVNAGIDRSESYAVNWSKLSDQLDHTSNTLKKLKTCPTHRVMTLQASDIKVGSILTLDSSARQSLVVNVYGKKVVFDQITIGLEGSSQPSNIIWNFPEATEVVLIHSGVHQPESDQATIIGIPGTFVAPHAEVRANNVLVTGAIFAKSFVGSADQDDCSGKVSGQVNPGCFRSSIPGVGCGKPQHHGK